jgi:hypothetical protein
VVLCALQTKSANHQLECKTVSDSVVRKITNFYLLYAFRQVGVCMHAYLPVKMEQTECSKTSAYILQMPGNYPKESIQHLEHGESLKSRIQIFISESYSFLDN